MLINKAISVCSNIIFTQEVALIYKYNKDLTKKKLGIKIRRHLFVLSIKKHTHNYVYMVFINFLIGFSKNSVGIIFPIR